MKKDSVRFEISGIKCDNKTCDFKDMSVPLADYPQWLNKPCPKCESNLLTEKDFATVIKMLKVTEFLNRFLPKRKQSSKDYTTNVELNGTGKVFFKKDKK